MRALFSILIGIVLLVPEDGYAALKSRWSIGYRAGINSSVEFSSGQLPDVVNPQAPGVTMEGRRWNYINGYVFPDVGGGSVDSTYWGHAPLDESFLNGVPLSDLDTVDGLANLSRYDSDSSFGEEEDLLHGIELIYSKVLGAVSSGHWGVQGGFSYVTTSSRNDFSNPIFIRTDHFSAPGAPIPSTLYQGSFDPPGPERLILLDRISTGTTPVPSALWVGQRSFEADLFDFRLGGYVELPVSRRFAINLNAGAAVGIAQTDLEVSETVSLLSATPSLSSSSGDDLLFGGYAGIELWYSLTRRWSLFGGVEYQYMQSAEVTAGSTSARLNLDQSIYGSLGVGFAF